MEAFFGVLYGGVASAIMLGKLMRGNAAAGVLWSYPIVLRYGSGVNIEQDEQQKHDDYEHNNHHEPVPYPVLEFRVANQAYARDGGEIANANVQVWASVLEKHAAGGLKAAARTNGTGMSRQQRFRKQQQMKQERDALAHAKKKRTCLSFSNCDDPSSIESIAGKTPGGTVFTKLNTAGNYIAGIGKQLVTSPAKALSQRLHSSKSVLVDVPENTPIPPIDTNTKHGDIAEVSTETSQSITSFHAVSRNLPRTLEVQKQPQGMGHLRMNSAAMAGCDGGAAHEKIVADAPAFLNQRSPGVVMMDDGSFARPTIYSRVELENDSHPFFRRVWTLRHRIDQNSPLLDNIAHGILRQFLSNGGEGWPPELNSYKKLREHVKFEDISVTLSGTDNITGSSVYGCTGYTSGDMVIGYRFANALVKEKSTGHVGVDLGLISDVLEQHGGGGEPLLDMPELDPPMALADICMDIENQLGGMTQLEGPSKKD
jgi:hypothetical protein